MVRAVSLALGPQAPPTDRNTCPGTGARQHRLHLRGRGIEGATRSSLNASVGTCNTWPAQAGKWRYTEITGALRPSESWRRFKDYGSMG